MLKTLVGLVLIMWEPLNFASAALGVLPTIQYRGLTPVVELILHGVVAALGAAGGLALLHERPNARGLATVAIVASGVRMMQSLYWSSLPRHVAPGTEPLYTAFILVAVLIALALVRIPTSS